MKLLYLLCLMLVLISCSKNEVETYSPNTSCICSDLIIADHYTYPYAPPSKQWDSVFKIGGYSLAYQLYLQVPTATANKMSSGGLIKSLLDNPIMVSSFTSKNSWFLGRDNYLNPLFASWELNKRTDAATAILNYYNKYTPCCIDNIALTDTSNRTAIAFKQNALEIICTQDSLLNKFSSPEKKSFIRLVLDHAALKDNYPSFGKDRTSSALLAAAIMRTDAYPPFKEALNNNQDLKNFVLGSMLTNNNSLELIWYHAKRFALI